MPVRCTAFIGMDWPNLSCGHRFDSGNALGQRYSMRKERQHELRPTIGNGLAAHAVDGVDDSDRRGWLQTRECVSSSAPERPGISLRSQNRSEQWQHRATHICPEPGRTTGMFVMTHRSVVFAKVFWAHAVAAVSTAWGVPMPSKKYWKAASVEVDDELLPPFVFETFTADLPSTATMVATSRKASVRIMAPLKKITCCL